jgi:porin
MIPVATPPPPAITITMPPAGDAVALAMRGHAPPPAPGAAPDPTVTQSAQPQAATAPAARPASRNPQDVHLLGDWFGVRRDLVKAGITPTMAFVQHGLANVRGGREEKFITAGQFTAGVQLDLQQLTGTVPGTFQITIVRRFGHPFNANTGLSAAVNPLSIQGRGETWRFSQFWYRTQFGKLDVRMGRMILNEDFNQGRCDFVSGYFCLGENTRAYSNIWPTNPVSQWGVRLQYPIAKDVVVKTAAYQYNPKNLDMERNFYFGWKGGTGVLVPSEVAWTPRIGGKLAGTYAAGFYYSSADMNDPVLNTRRQIRSIYGGSALVRHSEWGAWLNARQQLIAPNKNGSNSLAVFANMAIASEQSAPNSIAMAIGLNYTGLVPGRPRDEIGFAVGRARVNDRITEAAKYANANGHGPVAVRTNEYAVEGYYGIAVAPGFVFQPDIQFIFNPSGDRSRQNAVLVGFRTAITL